MRKLKRLLMILACVLAAGLAAYFSYDKWAVRRETLTFHDPARNNPLMTVHIAVRRDKEIQANLGIIKLPVAVLSQSETVGDHFFLPNAFAARGYLAITIQHDLPTGPSMVAKVGEVHADDLPQIEREASNIRFALQEMKKILPNADYTGLTLAGYSTGGEISKYFARKYPDEVRKVVTLDNEHVSLLTNGKFKILSFRSKDSIKSDPGVVSDEAAEKAAINTGFQHNEMRDIGPDDVENIKGMLDKFLNDSDTSEPPHPGSDKTVILTENRKKNPGSVFDVEPSISDNSTAVEAACRERNRRRGVVSNGPCIDVDAIVNDLEQGSYFFNDVKTAYVGVPFKLVLVLQTSPTQDVKQPFAGLSDPVTEVKGKFARTVEATLHGDDLMIEPPGSRELTATASNAVKWEWKVTPQSDGKKTLNVEVVATILAGPDKHKVQIRTLSKDIEIQVSTFQQLKLYVAQANGFVVAAATVLPSLAALIGFVPKFRKFIGSAWRRVRGKPQPRRGANRAKR